MRIKSKKIASKDATRYEKSWKAFFGDKYFLLPALAALLIAISRYPLKVDFLVFFGFIPLFVLLKNGSSATKKEVVKAAVSFSTVYTLVALYWITVVTLPGFIGMLILFALYFIILFWIIFAIRRFLPKLTLLGFTTCWMTFEWLQNYGEFRFPWFNIGYSLAEYKALVQVAEYGGIYLLSLLILVVNILLYHFLTMFPAKKSFRYLGSCFLLLVIWTGVGIYRYRSLEIEEKDMTAALVQVSIPQHIKWCTTFYDSTLALYEKYTQKAAEREPDLIIWPESAIPERVLRSPSATRFVSEIVEQTGIDLFLGFPHYDVVEVNDERRRLHYNSATAFHRDGTIAPPFYKNILVPFGERIPFLDVLPFLRDLDFGQANWEYGEELMFYELQKDDALYTYSPLICFEIAFPDMNRRIAEHEPDFMVTITNDAWFEKTIGPYQHGMMTVIRAVETRTQYYRAANTGISMIVDPLGNITRSTELFEKTVIDDELRVYPYKTFYVSTAKNYPFVFLIISAVLVIVMILNHFSWKR